MQRKTNAAVPAIAAMIDQTRTWVLNPVRACAFSAKYRSQPLIGSTHNAGGVEAPSIAAYLSTFTEFITEARHPPARAHPDWMESGCALAALGGACPYRKTGVHFSIARRRRA